ncbi:hypothetical protein GMA11_03140 [Granulicatella sp. zg-ZJ]|uniref:hypothetical protein n=1 Tax=Granulicatella sp. zg-ZJ TaxID=2678504 RepID=UPI0013D47BC0|nr:hypothetical protein [Granulicatella sp. zg-ZJ]MBS4750179.1 hypothetical protein [Carnobacteriaceae bacterium zg-ZUI78]NEW62382.1 hypothetical protein [Granulicatella sp. zg-ZJ]
MKTYTECQAFGYTLRFDNTLNYIFDKEKQSMVITDKNMTEACFILKYNTDTQTLITQPIWNMHYTIQGHTIHFYGYSEEHFFV